MDIDQRKEQLIKEIERYSKLIDRCNKTLNKLNNSIQPYNSELYNGIENFINIKQSVGNYEYILGGDGRSAPWSETRKGKIATISIKHGYYLTNEQIQIVKEYIHRVYNPDYIEL